MRRPQRAPSRMTRSNLSNLPPCCSAQRTINFVVVAQTRASSESHHQAAAQLTGTAWSSQAPSRSQAIDLYFIFSLVEFFVVGCSSNSGGVG